MAEPVIILYAEDDADDILFFEQALDATGIQYNLITFQNGRAAHDYLKAISKTDLIPDVMVLDINMPYMDGIALLSAIKQDANLSSIPTFMLSTTSHESYKNRCAELGCIDYYVKPIKHSELEFIIRDIFKKAA